MKTQNNNRTNNFRIAFNGKTLTLAQWSEELGIPRQTIRNRLLTLGWPVEKALAQPSRKHLQNS